MVHVKSEFKILDLYRLPADSQRLDIASTSLS